MKKDVTDTESNTTSVILDPQSFLADALNESEQSDQLTLDTEIEEVVVTDESDPVDDDSLEALFADEEEVDDEDVEIIEVVEGDESEEIVDEIEDDDTEVVEEEVDEEPNKEFFYVGNHSVYKTEEELFKGVEAKDEYIKKMEGDIKDHKESLVSVTQKLQVYTDTIPESVMEEAAIQALLPEEFRGKTEEDFEDDEKFRSFLRARVKAETDREKAKSDAEKVALENSKKRDDLKTDADNFVKEIAVPSFFGIRNLEQKDMLRTVLSETNEGGYTPMDTASLITQVFGKDAGRQYLEGLRLRIQGEDSEGKDQTKVTHKQPAKKVIERVKKVKNVKKAPVTPAPQQKPKDQLEGKNPKDMIMAGLS